MAPKKSSAQKAAEAAARKAAADAAAVNNLSLEEVQALLASKQQAAAAAAKAAADKAAADQAAADKAAAEAAAPAGTGATPSPGDLTPSLVQLIASSVAAAVATEFAKRDATPAGTTAEDRPTNTSAVAKPGLTAEEQAVEHLGGALGQGAAAGESFLAKAQREKAAAAKQVREANEKLRLATLIADGAANLGGTGTADLHPRGRDSTSRRISAPRPPQGAEQAVVSTSPRPTLTSGAWAPAAGFLVVAAAVLRAEARAARARRRRAWH